MNPPARLLKPALKLLSFGVVCCNSVVQAATSGSPDPTQTTLAAVLGTAALKAAGDLANEVSGGLLYEKLFGPGVRPGNLLQHKTLIEVTGEAFWRALVKVAAERDSPDDAGGQKLNEFIRQHGLSRLQARWHSFLTETIAPQMKELSGPRLLEELGGESLLHETQLAELVIVLTSDGDEQESYLDDETLAAVSIRLREELPAAFADVLTDQQSAKPYRLLVVQMLTEMYAGQIEILHRLEEVLARLKGLAEKDAPHEVHCLLEEVLARLKELIEKGAPPRFDVPHQLPAPPLDFTGREDELNELRALVKSGSVTISSLHGMGGVGKTALALKLADEFRDDYPDGQIYLDLKGVSRRSESGLRQEPLTAVEVMSHVIRAWHPEEKLPDRETELAGRYRTVLADKRVLLLFDNARNAVQLTPLIPGNRQCLLLVTSRQRFALGGREPYDIDKLKPEDAVKLLRHNSSRLSEQDAKEIAEICDYLPMALKPAVSLLGKSRSLTPEKLIKKLRDKKQRLSLRDAERKDELLNISIEASFQLSYELLAEDEISDLPQCWRTLAVFPDTFDEAAAVAVWALDEDAAREMLDALDSYSLIEITKAANTELRYGLHDLAHDFADARLNDEERNSAQRRHARHYQQVLSRVEDLYLSGHDAVKQGLQLFDVESNNIRTGQAWASCHAKLDDEAAQLCINYPRAAFYTLQLRLHLRKERIPWLDVGLNAARRLNDQLTESVVLGHIGVAWDQSGEARKAAEYHERALAIARKISDRRGEGAHLGNLGGAWIDLGDARKAIEYYEQALAIAREISNSRLECAQLEGLGSAWRDLGDAHKSIEYCEKALAIAREIGDPKDEGILLGNLGNAWLDSGEMHKAIEYYEQALVIARAIGYRLGEDHHLFNLGLAWRRLGDTRKAIEYYEQALAIALEIGDRRGVEHYLHNLGLAWSDLGDEPKAIEYYEQALAIALEIGDRRGVEDYLHNLGLAWSDLGDEPKAIEYYEQALAIGRELDDRRGEGVCLGNLGNAWYRLGEARKAIEHYEQSLDIAREISDRRNERLWQGNLGNAWADLGEVSKAIEYYEQALAIARDLGDRGSEGVFLGNLGGAWSDLGDKRKATEYCEQALVIAREIGDRRNEGIWLRNLGKAHADLGEAREAIKYYEQALAIHRDLGDKESERAVLTTLGFRHALWGEAQEAIKYCEQALEFDRELGDKRGEANNLSNLGIACSLFGDEQRANNCVAQAFAIAEELGDKELKGVILEDRGEACLKLGEVDKAKQFFAEALKIYDEIGSARADGVRQKLAKLPGE